jgi:hypothetical protein
VGPGRCECCGREADELHISFAAGAICCERCHSRAAPPASAAARRYRRPKPPPPPKPSRYALLVDDVLAALKRSSLEATGWEWSIGGLGTGEGRYHGWCPVCTRGLVDIQLLNLDPPRARIDHCGNGCIPDLIYDAIWPAPETSPPTTSTAAAAAGS